MCVVVGKRDEDIEAVTADR